MRAWRTGISAAVAILIATAVLSPLSAAEVSQKQGVRVSVKGALAPTSLPRRGAAPVAVSLSGRIATTTNATTPPQLQNLTIEINRQGHLSYKGLPRCRLGKIDPSTSQQALAACKDALVGEGHFSADVRIPEQSPFPSEGKLLAFNGTLGGSPAIFAHIYGTKPTPTSYVLPFLVKSSGGTYGTILEASLPQVTGEWGFITAISMNLNRTFSSNGKTQGYLSAGCPAPKGLNKAFFPLLRTRFAFADGLNIDSVLHATCKAEG
jgi:hypothetical protein